MKFLLILITIETIAFCQKHQRVNDDEEPDDGSTISENSNHQNVSLKFIKELENVTIDSSRKFIKLTCEVQSYDLNNGTESNVTFTWQKFEAPIETSKKISIKNQFKNNKYRSTLKIAQIEQFDRGFYDCIASNGQMEIRSTALVEVHVDTSRSTIGQDLHSHYDEMTTIPQTPTLFDALDDGNKQLEAAIRNGQTTFDIPIRKANENVSIRKHLNFSEPFCQVYRGETCRQYLEDRFVFVQPPYTQVDIENKLRNAFLVISQSKDISSSCNKYAVPSLCYSAFPLCTDTKQISSYQFNLMKGKFPSKNQPNQFQGLRNELTNSLRRICKNDCLLLETELCSKEYAIAKRHPVIGQALELEECHLLPNETQANSKNCLGLGVTHEIVNKDDSCYWDDGQLYRGVENISESGKSCLRWSHLFQVHMSDHPELIGHNYCRNPGGDSSQPFCYIDQNKKELCNITKCAYIVGIYVTGSFLAVALITGMIAAAFCCRKRNKAARNLQNNISTANKNIYGNPGPNSPIELNTLLPPNIPPQRNHHPSKNGYASVPQYTHKEVNFIEELGEGAFGKVYKGELKTKNGRIFVAVKSLKENANAKTQADFQREIELISELKHTNIICLLGVVVKQEPMCMLFEFMSEGDLHEFLINNSPNEGKSLSQTQFLHIAIQIAQGMEYLSENHYVHRDLAARNCLVSKDIIVKISDFGLSRDMYSCDYYRVQSKSLLPVRWMPPESILYGKFTTESDVWSYGVVLWEIYSYGLQPYYGRNNQEVINMIRYRELLPCPEACPSYCYSLMVECWAELAIRRPSFGEIGHRLRVWKQNGQKVDALQPGAGAHSLHRFGHAPRPEPAAPAGPGAAGRLNESQSSLTSRSSSLGNKTQSTSLSNEHRHRRSQNQRRVEEGASLERLNPKNTVV